MICSKCGAEILDGSLFCTECGSKVTSEPAPKTDTEATFGAAPAAPAAPVIQPEPEKPQPTYSNQPKYQASPEKVAEYMTDSSKVVKTGQFFWLDVLYCIPLVGLVAAIIIASAAKNSNIKHHAASKLIELVVGIVLGIAAVILILIAFKSAGMSIYDYVDYYNVF